MRKTIFHIDVNSAFLSWTAADKVLNQNEKLDLREICSIVGGDQKSRHGIVLAKSIPAKRFHIQTGEPIGKAREKCPGLVIVPPDYALYVQASRAFVKLLRRYCPVVEQYSIDEVWADVTGTAELYGSPVMFAEYLKGIIYEQLGFTVNIGISTNKLLAKMASEFKKPDLVHTLYPEEIRQKMWGLGVRELFFIGRATERKLHSIGIYTIGQLAATDVRLLKSHLKKHGEIIHSFAWGDSQYLDGLIEIQQNENKGYGNSMTLPVDFTELSGIEAAMLSLCETLGTRLRADRVRIRCVSVSITYYDFVREGHQCQMYSESNTTEEIYMTARKVLHELWNGRAVRQIGVHTGKVTKGRSRQYNLFDLDRYDKREQLDQAVDLIRQRYGKDSIMRACFLNHQQLKHMSGGISDEKLTGMTKPLN